MPRFNMPFELGLFLGAKRYGDESQRAKRCLILERKKFSYQKYLSDIAGHDTEAHDNDPRKAMDVVIKWLQSEAKIPHLPGIRSVWDRYAVFLQVRKLACDELGWDSENLSFSNLTHLIHEFLKLER